MCTVLTHWPNPQKSSRSAAGGALTGTWKPVAVNTSFGWERYLLEQLVNVNQSLKSVRINMQSPPQSRSCTVLSLVDSGIHQLTFISLPGRQLKDPMESNLTQPSLQPDSAAAGWPGWRCRDLWKLHPPPSGFCDFKMFWSLLQKSMYTTERVLYKHNFEVFFTLVAYFCYFILPHHNILRANNVLFTLLHLFNKFSY